jgi:hypothetical protein
MAVDLFKDSRVKFEIVQETFGGSNTCLLARLKLGCNTIVYSNSLSRDVTCAVVNAADAVDFANSSIQVFLIEAFHNQGTNDYL